MAFILVQFSHLSSDKEFKDFNPFPNKPLSAVQVFRKHCGKKEKLLVTSNFSYSHSVFYPLRELFTIFMKIKIVVCKVFRFGRA